MLEEKEGESDMAKIVILPIFSYYSKTQFNLSIFLGLVFYQKMPFLSKKKLEIILFCTLLINWKFIHGISLNHSFGT